MIQLFIYALRDIANILNEKNSIDKEETVFVGNIV